ncbi:hypothetical protein A9Q84_02770 [Halobacteriovorax marinus]|uniref:Response regulatory domain-containing protein n=1 Tax=Halobacteriovorax marinus TaxID=97084 RepID=A0A1Y5FCP8_9BACT|nr:hypothetical protein A9Q84_02770 [Halobacteriovorax marinus]
MKKVLIVDDEPDILDILEILFESEFDNEIIRATSGNEAIKLLESDEAIEVIVSDFNMPNGTGGDLLKYNVENKNLPFVMCTSEFYEDFDESILEWLNCNLLNSYVQKPVDEELLIESVKQGLGEEIDKPSTNIDSFDYKRVKIDFLIKFLNENTNIFLKVGSGKFIKIIHEGDLTEKSQLEKYIQKGEVFAYLEEKDFQPFMNNLLNKMSRDIDATGSFSEIITVGALGYEVVHNSLHHLGINEEQKNYVNKFVVNSVKQLSRNPEMNGLLNKFYKNKGYQVGHTLLTVHIAYLICKNTSYSNVQHVEKLTFAAFLHDLFIEKGELSEIIDKDGKDFHDLSMDDKQIVSDHMLEACKFVDEMKIISSDVKNIILEHHEKGNGSGFPRSLAAIRISPLSCIFILALRTAHFMYFHDYPTEKHLLVEDLEANFSSGNFKTPFNALLKVIEEH